MLRLYRFLFSSNHPSMKAGQRGRWRAGVVATVGCLVSLHRRRLRNTTVIGVTGSAGKSTCKDLLYELLSACEPGIRTLRSKNRLGHLFWTLAKARRRHRFMLVEMGAFGPDTLDELVRYARPDVGVVLTVGLDHYKAFRSVEAVAREKAKLVEALPSDGWAILNADDPLVAAMAERVRSRVLTFGAGPDADVRYAHASSVWPDRLSFELWVDGQCHPVRTRLLGTHWMPVLLAAVCVGLVRGLSVDRIITTLAGFESMPRRMSVAERGGVTFIQDDWKAPYWSIGHVLDFMRAARAERKIFICGTLSDYPGSASPKYRAVANKALAISDRVVFIGPNASYAAKKSVNVVAHPSLRRFASIREAALYLQVELQPGDLVMVKGSAIDHLERLVIQRDQTVQCWGMGCGVIRVCQYCPMLKRPEA